MSKKDIVPTGHTKKRQAASSVPPKKRSAAKDELMESEA